MHIVTTEMFSPGRKGVAYCNHRGYIPHSPERLQTMDNQQWHAIQAWCTLVLDITTLSHAARGFEGYMYVHVVLA